MNNNKFTDTMNMKRDSAVTASTIKPSCISPGSSSTARQPSNIQKQLEYEMLSPLQRIQRHAAELLKGTRINQENSYCLPLTPLTPMTPYSNISFSEELINKQNKSKYMNVNDNSTQQTYREILRQNQNATVNQRTVGSLKTNRQQVNNKLFQTTSNFRYSQITKRNLMQKSIDQQPKMTSFMLPKFNKRETFSKSPIKGATTQKQQHHVCITGYNVDLEKKKKLKKLQPMVLADGSLSTRDKFLSQPISPNNYLQAGRIAGENIEDLIDSIGNFKKIYKKEREKQKQKIIETSYSNMNSDSFSGYGSIPLTPQNLPSISNQGRAIFSANNSLHQVMTPVSNMTRPETYGLVPNLKLDQLAIASASSSLNGSRRVDQLKSSSSTTKLKEDKQKRLHYQKFDEFAQEPIIQNVLIKLWKLIIKLQYKHLFDKNKTQFDMQMPTLPLDNQIYQRLLPLLKQSLGALYDSDFYVAGVSQQQIFFDRFCFDVISLIGKNLYDLSVSDIEYIFRTVHGSLTHSFGPKQGVTLLSQQIAPNPFSPENLYLLNHQLHPNDTSAIDLLQPSIRYEDRLETSENRGRLPADLNSSLGVNTEQDKRSHAARGSGGYAPGELANQGSGFQTSSQADGVKSFEMKDESLLQTKTLNIQDKDVQELNQVSIMQSENSPHYGNTVKQVQMFDRLPPASRADQRDENQETNKSAMSVISQSSTVNSNEGLTVKEILAKKEAERQKKLAEKRLKIKEVLDYNSKCISFEPHVDVLPLSGNSLIKKQYFVMNSIHQKKRNNLQDAGNKRTGNEEFRQVKNALSSDMQVDVMEQFQTYDEKLFDICSREDLLELSKSDVFSETEQKILKANRIERKTLLLECMQIYDTAVQCTIDEKSFDNTKTKQESLIKKLGADKVKRLIKECSLDSRYSKESSRENSVEYQVHNIPNALEADQSFPLYNIESGGQVAQYIFAPLSQQPDLISAGLQTSRTIIPEHVRESTNVASRLSNIENGDETVTKTKSEENLLKQQNDQDVIVHKELSLNIEEGQESQSFDLLSKEDETGGGKHDEQLKEHDVEITELSDMRSIKLKDKSFYLKQLKQAQQNNDDLSHLRVTPSKEALKKLVKPMKIQASVQKSPRIDSQIAGPSQSQVYKDYTIQSINQRQGNDKIQQVRQSVSIEPAAPQDNVRTSKTITETEQTPKNSRRIIIAQGDCVNYGTLKLKDSNNMIKKESLLMNITPLSGSKTPKSPGHQEINVNMKIELTGTPQNKPVLKKKIIAQQVQTERTVLQSRRHNFEENKPIKTNRAVDNSTLAGAFGSKKRQMGVQTLKTVRNEDASDLSNLLMNRKIESKLTPKVHQPRVPKEKQHSKRISNPKVTTNGNIMDQLNYLTGLEGVSERNTPMHRLDLALNFELPYLPQIASLSPEETNEFKKQVLDGIKRQQVLKKNSQQQTTFIRYSIGTDQIGDFVQNSQGDVTLSRKHFHVYEQATNKNSDNQNPDLISFHKTSQRYLESSHEINLIDVETNSVGKNVELDTTTGKIVFTCDDDKNLDTIIKSELNDKEIKEWNHKQKDDEETDLKEDDSKPILCEERPDLEDADGELSPIRDQISQSRLQFDEYNIKKSPDEHSINNQKREQPSNQKLPQQIQGLSSRNKPDSQKVEKKQLGVKQITFDKIKNQNIKEISHEKLKHVNSGKTLSYEKACKIHRSISPEREESFQGQDYATYLRHLRDLIDNKRDSDLRKSQDKTNKGKNEQENRGITTPKVITELKQGTNNQCLSCIRNAIQEQIQWHDKKNRVKMVKDETNRNTDRLIKRGPLIPPNVKVAPLSRVAMFDCDIASMESKTII